MLIIASFDLACCMHLQAATTSLLSTALDHCASCSVISYSIDVVVTSGCLSVRKLYLSSLCQCLLASFGALTLLVGSSDL